MTLDTSTTTTTSNGVEIPGVPIETLPHSHGSSTSSNEGAAVTEPAAAEVAAPSAVSEAEAKPDKSRRSGGMAQGGAAVGMPPAPKEFAGWPDAISPDENYEPEEIDASDLAKVNQALNQARARVFRTSKTLKMVQRLLAERQAAYDRAMRRQLVSLSGGSAETRKAQAEIACEHLEDSVIIGRQLVEEWKRQSIDSRDNLKAVENLAHNARAQLDVQ